MREIYEKMREHANQLEQSKVRGLSTLDVIAQNYTEAELDNLVNSLRKNPFEGNAAFRLSSFIFHQQQSRVPEHLRREAADIVAEHFEKIDKAVDISAIEVFVSWGLHRPDYKKICRSLLHHPRTGIRRMALAYAGFFLEPKNYDLLFDFRNDSDVSETAMGGPLRYTLRDYALEVLEHLTQCPVRASGDCFEDSPDGRISYRSWSLFLNWYNGHKK